MPATWAAIAGSGPWRALPPARSGPAAGCSEPAAAAAVSPAAGGAPYGWAAWRAPDAMPASGSRTPAMTAAPTSSRAQRTAARRRRRHGDGLVISSFILCELLRGGRGAGSLSAHRATFRLAVQRCPRCRGLEAGTLTAKIFYDSQPTFSGSHGVPGPSRVRDRHRHRPVQLSPSLPSRVPAHLVLELVGLRVLPGGRRRCPPPLRPQPPRRLVAAACCRADLPGRRLLPGRLAAARHLGGGDRPAGAPPERPPPGRRARPGRRPLRGRDGPGRRGEPAVDPRGSADAGRRGRLRRRRHRRAAHLPPSRGPRQAAGRPLLRALWALAAAVRRPVLDLPAAAAARSRLARRPAAVRVGGRLPAPPRGPGAGDDGNRPGDLAARGGALARLPGFRADRPPRLLRQLDRARQPQPLPRAPAAGDGANRRRRPQRSGVRARPGPLQGHQRLARSPPRRRDAAPRRRPPARQPAPGRHHRPAGRRRVRRVAARRGRRARHGAAGREGARFAAPAAPTRRLWNRLQRQPPHQPLPRGRRRSRGAAEEGRRRDVPGEVARPRRPAAVCRRDGRPRPRAAVARERPAPGADRRRAAAVLPAGARRRDRPHPGSRGAAALAAPAARAAGAGRFPLDRRDERPVEHARSLGAGHRLPPGAGLARRGDAAAAAGGESLGAALPAPRSHRARQGRAMGDRPLVLLPRARDHRDAGHAECRGKPGGAERLEGARGAHRHRRLRHRLLVALLPAQLPHRHLEDRRFVHPFAHRRQRQPRDRLGGDRAGAQPRHPGGGGGRRDRGAVALAARPGLRRGPRLLLQPAAARRQLRAPGLRAPRVAVACRRHRRRRGPRGARLEWRDRAAAAAPGSARCVGKEPRSMPEGPKIETEKLRETVTEELEREGSGFLKQIALTTAILAAFAAVAALLAGGTVNEALVKKTEATTLQAQASDQWAYYQAKGIKREIQEAAPNAWLAAGKVPPPRFAQEASRYRNEQKEIDQKARELERRRDERSREAGHLLHDHHGYANAVALFQVSIALGAVAALSRSRWVWYGSMAAGAAGIVLFAVTFFH